MEGVSIDEMQTEIDMEMSITIHCCLWLYRDVQIKF
jgi:hypothetical protein